jgi:glycosyltransferase involved in cell wall biosynthesis
MSSKTLIVCPHMHLPGGIAGYYQSLQGYLKNSFEFFHLGARETGETTYQKPLNLIRDLFSLNVTLKRTRNEIGTVMFNPSLIPFCVVREGLLLCVAKAHGCKCIVFFRGWDNHFADVLERYFFKLFMMVFNQADAFIVLSKEFETRLRGWGFKQPVHIETTTVDDRMLNGFSMPTHRHRSNVSQRNVKLLFLSRVEREKGIFEAIDAVSVLKKRHPGITLYVAGVGACLEAAKMHAEVAGISDSVHFLGWVSGQAKSDLLYESDLLLLPSSREGMPNCVLEAMAFGLPVLTTPIGGINDFFENRRFGFLIDDKSPARIAELIETIISDDKLYHTLSHEAFAYAHDRFLASKVAERISRLCSAA